MIKVRKRILEIRRRSRINLPKENLWYYNEVSSIAQSAGSRKGSFRNDRSGIMLEEYNQNSLANAGRNRNIEDSLFVVDWQMADI